MEGWQKGAAAVLRLSSAGKERYFNRFPERKAWFETNHPEHFGRSAAVATTSLKNVTKAKQQKQRLAAIRQAAEKRDQSMVLSPERRLMAQRRREGGEGLAGGMDTVADIRKSIAAGMPVRSGGIGSLFEADGAIVKKGDKWVFNGVAYDSLKDAQNAKEGAYDFQRKVTDTSVSGNREKMFNTLSSIGQNMVDIGTNVVLPMATGQIGAGIEGLKTLSSRLYGTSWPSAGEGGRWEASMRQQGRPVYTSEVDLDAHLRKASPGAGPQKDEEGNLIIPKRIPFSKTVQVGDVPRKKGEMYFTGRNMEEKLYEDEDEKSMREEDNLAKEFAQKIIEEKRLQECMPMAMMIKSKSSEDGDNKWDYMDTWEKNPIKKGSTSSEAEDEPGEYDYEGDMAKSQLRSIMHNSKMLHDILEDNTNLPEWVQSKITLAEDYILTAANYMRGELDKMNEETENVNAIHRSMERTMEKDLPFDPTGERKPGDVVDKSGAVHTQMSRVRHLAQMALQAGIPQPKMPLEGEEGHAQIRAEHEAQTGASEQIAEGAAAQRKSKSDDLVKRSMLPDRSVIPAGKGFGDDLKRKKIMKKVSKALQKKKITLPTNDPYANELVPQSMLPDVPGYPEGYQMEEQVVEQPIEQPIEQQVETPVVEENASPFVAAGSNFLTRTSARLVYGDKND